MTFSRALLGTDKNKVRMTWLEYIFQHLVPTAFQSFNDNFRMWRDLMTDNFEGYALLKDDDPFQECYDWFWSSINMDETYPKEFLEYLMQLADDVETGKEKVIPIDEGYFDRMKDLVGDMIDE